MSSDARFAFCMITGLIPFAFLGALAWMGAPILGGIAFLIAMFLWIYSLGRVLFPGDYKREKRK